MKVKIECLPEPKLAFGLGNTGLEPRRVLAKAGPVDAGRIHEVRLALIGPAPDVAAARGWLRRLNQFIPARESNSARYRDWPGAGQALGVRFVIGDRFVRPVLPFRKGLQRRDLVTCSTCSMEGFRAVSATTARTALWCACRRNWLICALKILH